MSSLFITVSPEIHLDVKLLAGITVKAGTKIELPAVISGKPDPRITWTKAEHLLKPDNRIVIDTKPDRSIVTISDTMRSDSGTYIIEAVNTSGRATAVVEVNILGNSIIQSLFTIRSIICLWEKYLHILTFCFHRQAWSTSCI